ncbi:MAG: AmmeMemoRadiSam system protein B [Bacteroidia bacterium]
MRYLSTFATSVILVLAFGCNPNAKTVVKKIRPIIDTLGFGQYDWQMDSILARIDESDKQDRSEYWSTVICPHDDYAYAAGLYSRTLAGIRAKTVLMIGVAHRAKNFDLADRIILGTHTHWAGPYGKIRVSALRNDLLNVMQASDFVVHDSMMALEHSLEAITPFLQAQNPAVEIIPILVPYMKFADMDRISEALTEGLAKIMAAKNLKWGEDIAIVISNDAVHYGDEGWGGKNLAPFGSDSLGNAQAREKDKKIIAECLSEEITTAKIKRFTEYSVQPADYKEYQWVWCGRYSVPFGMLVANKMTLLQKGVAINGKLLDYRTSITNPHIEVSDLGMGHTAPANQHHWVAYCGIGYK